MKHLGAKENKRPKAVGTFDEEKPKEENGLDAPRPEQAPKPNPRYRIPEWALP
jgi:hypothetical protein